MLKTNVWDSEHKWLLNDLSIDDKNHTWELYLGLIGGNW